MLLLADWNMELSVGWIIKFNYRVCNKIDMHRKITAEELEVFVAKIKRKKEDYSAHTNARTSLYRTGLAHAPATIL